MNFSEKLKAARKKAKLSQEELAQRAGISTRTLQNYELGKRYPANLEIAVRLADELSVTAQELLTVGETAIVTAKEPSAKAQLEKLVSNLSGLFAGGELLEEDRDAAMEAIIAAYWAAKKEKRRMSDGRETGKK